MNPDNTPTPNPYQQPQPEDQAQQPQQPQPVAPNDPANTFQPQAQYPSPATAAQANVPSGMGSGAAPVPYPSQFQNPAAASTPPIQTGMFSGRLNRQGFLLSLLYPFVYFLIPIALGLVLRGNTIANIIGFVFGIVGIIAMIPISISTAVRRWHDLNQSGWMALLSFVPLVSFFVLLMYLFVPGTKAANDYGAIDNRPSTLRKVFFGK